MWRAALLASVILVLFACDKGRINESYWRQRGAEAVTPLKKNLKRALIKAVEEGPVEAVTACHAVAPAVTKGAGSEVVKVGRTSHKLRNPKNAPKLWMQPLLQGYLTAPDQMEPRVVVLDDDTVGYVEPIYLQPMCVTCHGTAITPDVQERIDELYPTDEATGFEPGHFRGVFWAELSRN
ncbi:MAG: DUF3365 domain-containing protein [Myxococcales bacterium]|nr:DUF3365 domain-containing protein [Myxococcales bacterium]